MNDIQVQIVDMVMEEIHATSLDSGIPHYELVLIADYVREELMARGYTDIPDFSISVDLKDCTLFHIYFS